MYKCVAIHNKMRFYYGYDQENLSDISEKVEQNFLIENEYFIPSDDNLRSKILGDPYFGKLKFILIELNSKDSFFIYHNQSVKFPKNIDNKNQIEITTLRNLRYLWWNKVGRFIENLEQRLDSLHQWIGFGYGSMEEEREEQMMAIQFIEPKDKVLELGANYGRNSCLIGCLLEDDTQMVSLETCQKYIPILEYNRDINQLKFQIEPSGLSKKKLIQKRWITTPWELDNLPDSEYFWVPTITWQELKQKYPIDFNVLVADCEGALYYILQDEPNFLKGFTKILVENDYIQMEQYEFVKDKMEKNGFKNVLNLSGGLSWHCCKDCFYQVWIKTH